MVVENTHDFLGSASINATRSCGPCCLNCFALLTVEKFDAAALLHSQLRGSIYAQSVFNSQRIIYGMASRVGWVKNRVRARYVTHSRRQGVIREGETVLPRRCGLETGTP